MVARGYHHGVDRFVVEDAPHVGDGVNSARCRLRPCQAVSIGIVAACQLSILQGLATSQLRDRVERLLGTHRLPTRLPGGSWEKIGPWLRYDKKAREAGGTFTDWNGTPTISGGNGLSTNGRLLEAVVEVLGPGSTKG